MGTHEVYGSVNRTPGLPGEGAEEPSAHDTWAATRRTRTGCRRREERDGGGLGSRKQKRAGVAGASQGHQSVGQAGASGATVRVPDLILRALEELEAGE